MGVTLNLAQLIGNTEETNVLQACLTVGQVLCFSPKLVWLVWFVRLFFFLCYGFRLISARFFEIFA